MSVPEVRQCLDQSHPSFGAVAIKHGDQRWQIVHETRGGWGADDAVEGWNPINDDAVQKHANDPEHAETVPVEDGNIGHEVIEPASGGELSVEAHPVEGPGAEQR